MREKVETMAQYKILVVDDNADILDLLEILLTSEGYAVTLASSGEQALQLLSPELDLDILDIMMPGISGIRVCGLMTVPPILETEREKRQVFSQMRQLFIDMRGKNIDNVNMSVLSMGMSSDYREAILEGATIIRVGSALFGRRNY